MKTPTPPASSANTGLKVLVFDVFGTCVDWRGSIIVEGNRLNAERGWKIDWPGLVDAWRGAYQPNMQRVRSGESPWTNLDALHLAELQNLSPKFGAPKRLSAADWQLLNTLWHRLHPWPDTVRGLKRLKAKFVIGTMSNGNVGLLTNMAKFAGMPWDVIFSAEWVQHYKPDRETYLSAAQFMQVKPAEVMLVAAHKGDLDGAARAGLKTAFVPRPIEYVSPAKLDPGYDGKFEKRFTYNAISFTDLATQLAC